MIDSINWDLQPKVISLSPSDREALTYAEALVGEMAEMMKRRDFLFIAYLLAMAAREIEAYGK